MSINKVNNGLKIFSIIVGINLVLILSYSFSHSNEPVQEEKEEMVRHEENTNCFKCHGENKYTMYNADSSSTITKLMPRELFIDTLEFYDGTHKTFKCSDCHSDEYNSVPHNPELRFDPMPGCIDCHGGDPEYEEYKFEQIDEQFQNSVHSKAHTDNFACWDCHDAHSYKSTARADNGIKDMVAYNNAMCLKCHANTINYMLLSDEENPDLIAKHEWLPNQTQHFKKVRCIECHTSVSDSVLVAHEVMPKDKAIKGCTECHSKNTRLNHTLYKFKAAERRDKNGFFNGAILEESFVIGANRNIYLNYGSIAIFILVLGGILIHAILRIIIKKKKNHVG